MAKSFAEEQYIHQRNQVVRHVNKSFTQPHLKKTKDKAVIGIRSNSFNSVAAAPTECVHTSHHCEGVDIDRNYPLEGKTNCECHRTNAGI